MTLKTTAAILAALTFWATPITAQIQNTTTQTTPTIAAVDLTALQASCVADRALGCDAATVAALNAFVLQKPTPAQINAQIGLIAAMLITAYDANPQGLFRVRLAFLAMQSYSSDSNQISALDAIDRLMRRFKPVTLSAFASALSPS